MPEMSDPATTSQWFRKTVGVRYMMHRLLYCLVAPAFFLLGACQDYDFKVNDKIVHSPTPLLRDLTTTDPGLTSCLEQAINDGAITAAQQLTSLDCSFAGIESLEGLATFTSLIALRLSSNKVRNLVEINRLYALEVLYLDENQVIDPVPLYSLPALRYLDLSGNKALQCPKNGNLENEETLILPQHCR
jgi:Leucine-rich repeat (LRR) protein